MGRIDTRKLHSLASGNSKLFFRRGKRAGVNTAVHILLDASGSMSGWMMSLAGQACFATASALHGIPGVSVGVTAFPGFSLPCGVDERLRWQTVAPLLVQGKKLHRNFSMNAGGSTPLDSALWWVVQQLLPAPEQRKIILIITDGKPDRLSATQTALKAAASLGMEVYGIGIAQPEIQQLLPDNSSKVINDITELAPAMLRLLHNAMVGINGFIR